MNNNKNVFCTQINLEEHYQTNIFIDKNIFNNGFYEDSENIKSKLLDIEIEKILLSEFGPNCFWYSLDLKNEFEDYVELIIEFKQKRIVMNNQISLKKKFAEP